MTIEDPELAELLQIPVVNKYARLNFPTQHPLNQTARARGLLGAADLVLGIEVVDMWGTVNDLRDLIHRTQVHIAKPTAKLISLGTTTIPLRANFQEFQRYEPVDLDIIGDGETTLPYLLEAVRRALPDAWALAAPDDIVAARASGAAIALRQLVPR